MKVLYLTDPSEDYLQDQVLLGLRNRFGDQIIDHPKKNQLYDKSLIPKNDLYGNGFTIWKLLPSLEIDRSNVKNRLRKGEFQIIIFGRIWRQINIFGQFIDEKLFDTNSTTFLFLDGEDHKKIFKNALNYGKYYKREQGRSFAPKVVEKIGFSIPNLKLRTNAIQKDKLFATHVQCNEAYKIKFIKEHCQTSYAFDQEDQYYFDIARSQYAITMKKAGWDCMRHYEIAANHTIPCFYNLHKKPKDCAPHDLIDMENVISFRNAKELMDKIQHIEKSNLYTTIQNQVFRWAEKNSCENIAKSIIDNVRFS